MALLTTLTKLIPELAACTALRPRDAVSTRPLKLLIEQPIAAGLPERPEPSSGLGGAGLPAFVEEAV